MAAGDFATQGGTDNIATNILTTVNGVVVSGVEAQRMKVGYGPDGSYRDVDTGFPLPAAVPSAVATGNITAANATPTTGAGTTNSSVVLTVPDHHSSITFTLSGTFSAGTVLAFQTSIDGNLWFYTNGRRNMDSLGVNETVSFTSTDVAGGAAPTGGNPSLWSGTAGGRRYYRITCITYTASDNIAVTILSSAGLGGTYLLGSIPGGSSNIGNTGSPAHTAATKSNWTVAATSGTVLAANTARKFATFLNDGTANVYLDLTGGTASATSYSVLLRPGDLYEMNTTNIVYTGLVTAIGSSATGTVRVTEWT